MPYRNAAATVAIVFAMTISASADLKVTPDKDNVVSSRLEGSWEVHAAISTRLGRNRGTTVEFKADSKVVETIPEKYEKFLADKTIYLAGTMKRNKTVHAFILIEMKGNPHVVYFRERDGDPLGDAESFNVVLAVAKDKPSDLLFIGGDFNNQPFTAYERSETHRK
jgi:hypothetical protein